jgi:pimeloyl-ACP methyl ester carboxylesterase/DNA-binding CsgD family transcriptional regulator
MHEEQIIRHVEIDGRTVAWSSSGSGPPLVIGGWWSSHLELDWADPAFRAFVNRLGEHRTVIRYDRPGTGMSDRLGSVPQSIDAELVFLDGLVREIGLDRIDLMGASSGCAVVSALAAEHPDVVERLVLYGGYARGEEIAPPAARRSLLAAVEAHWGLGSRVLTDLFLPQASSDERDQFVEFQRRSATPAVAAASLRAVYEFDATSYLSRVRSPTLVLHRRDDRAIPFALGRDLASRIPGAEFVALDGVDHLPWRGQVSELLRHVIAFLGGVMPAEPSAPEPGELSAREREILALVAEGNTDGQIAAHLVLSAHTVHRHIANIRTKLGVSSRAAAAAWAVSHGVI